MSLQATACKKKRETAVKQPLNKKESDFLFGIITRIADDFFNCESNFMWIQELIITVFYQCFNTAVDVIPVSYTHLTLPTN